MTGTTWTVPDDSLRPAGILAGDRVVLERIGEQGVRSGWLVLARCSRGLRVSCSLFRVVGGVAPESPAIRGSVTLAPLTGGGLFTVSHGDLLGRVLAVTRVIEGAPACELRPVPDRIADFARDLTGSDPLAAKCLLAIAAAAAAGDDWLDRLAAVILAEGQVLVDHFSAPGSATGRGRVH